MISLLGGWLNTLMSTKRMTPILPCTRADINATTTHLEIEPFTILGAVAGLIPLSSPQPVTQKHVSVRYGKTSYWRNS